MYESKNAWQGLDGVAADIMININTKQGTEENIFIIKEKIRLQLGKMKAEILNFIPEARDREHLKQKISSLKIEDGF